MGLGLKHHSLKWTKRALCRLSMRASKQPHSVDKRCVIAHLLVREVGKHEGDGILPLPAERIDLLALREELLV